MASIFLVQYLYVSKCKNRGTTFIQTNYPTVRGWSDMLLRERQKYDSKQNCFGEDEMVKFRDVIVVREQNFFMCLLFTEYWSGLSS